MIINFNLNFIFDFYFQISTYSHTKYCY